MIGHIRTIKSSLSRHKQHPAGQSRRDLNPKIRGGANSYRFSAAKSTFSKVNHSGYWLLWRWANRRPPNQPATWVLKRDDRQVDNRQAVFSEGKAHILWYQDTPITRFTKGTGKASPLNPNLREYWEERAKRHHARMTIQKRRRVMLRQQANKCGLCQVPLSVGDPIDAHHIMHRNAGGTESVGNTMLVHRWCHHAHHQRRGDKAAEA